MTEKRENYTKINAKTWDHWAENSNIWTVPITHEEFLKAKSGEWGVYLTPCKTVPQDWFGQLNGAKLLGLASGGGQQMPIFASLGAECTLFDYSDRQLAADALFAQREGYALRIIKGDMSRPLPFADCSFDLVFHPVSNCYIEEVVPLWHECFRILKSGGVLLAGMDNGVNFLFEDDSQLPLTVTHQLPYNPLQMIEEDYERSLRNWNGVQFSHSLEEQIGGQLQAGFRLTHLYEDRDRQGQGLIREFMPQYLATRAIKP
ncbi:MAG: class I SAM-dependent methyltransferase [Negativicutes bacterium]|nr:class I SAM-dependent methyltransferase [Negativicutes bacterium]